jgi:pimeloyl-ACP methyl ester carboxylesterase
MAADVDMGEGAAQALLGGDPDDVPDHYAEADTAALLPGGVPVTIVQGTEDKQVTVEMNRRLASAHAGVAGFTYVELEGVEHFALIDPLTDAFQAAVLPALTGAAVIG